MKMLFVVSKVKHPGKRSRTNATIKRFAFLVSVLFLFFSSSLRAASIELHTRDAVAWLPEQTISGSATQLTTRMVTVHQDKNTISVNLKGDNTFMFSIVLHDGENRIWVTAKDGGKTVSSDTVIMKLGYHPTPVIKPYGMVNRNAVTLQSITLSNPWKKLAYQWTGDKRNPAKVVISHAKDSVAKATIPQKEGMYYFNLMVTSGKDTARFQTYIERTVKSLKAFNIDSSYARWIDDAVMYGITPYAFVKNATYDDITAKLPEVKSLGVTAIWLQPLMQCYDKGQGYEVTDYFSLRDDLGTEAQLQRMIDTAKALGLRVLFDFVPNHTSVYHPYAQEAKKYGKNSHYYNFYQHTNDGVMYSSQYHKDKDGFIYYFWEDLVNLDYNNPEVQQWILEACKYWMKKYDLDGYRFDAVWGVNARQPDFGKRLQTELKVIKPDALLLAEDKGSLTATYTKGFDAGYDWTGDTSWVSQWSWQYDYNEENNLLIFNFPIAAKRGQMLRKALFRNGDSTHLRLRYIENNDLPRFIVSVDLERTKMTAAMMFALPGIPLIYNGQEIGVATTPSRKNPTFQRAKTIQSGDKDSLFTLYQKLASVRAQHTCLRTNVMEEVPVLPSATMAFRRRDEQENIVTVVNMDEAATTAKLDLSAIIKTATDTFTLSDLMTGEIFTYMHVDPASVSVPVKGYSTRILSVQTSPKSWVVLKEK